MSDKPNNYRFITPIDYLPLSKRNRESIYTEVLQEFQNANIKYAEVKLPDKSPITICVSLRKAIKQSKIKTLQVRYIKKRVYLEKIDPLKAPILAYQQHDVETRMPKTGEMIEIEHKATYERNYGLIRLTSQSRWFFPGYKLSFALETDIGITNASVTSAMAGTQEGDPLEGQYITGGLREWYKHHSELALGTKLAITCLEPYKRYKLNIKTVDKV